MKRIHLLTLWITVSLLPAQTQKTDIIVSDTTLVQRCKLLGNARMIAVGHPGGFNYAFDALHCAPTITWRGGFLNMKGETTGRGGNGCSVLGVKQPLGVAKVPFRVGNPTEMPKSLRFQGYRRHADTGAPTFRFTVDEVQVEQRLTSPEANVITIDFTFPQERTQPCYFLLDPSPHLQIALGEGLRWSTSGTLEIPAAQRTASLTIHLESTDKNFVRPVEKLTGAQLFANYCSACHSTDGTKLIGPSFQGLMGRQQSVLRDGKLETITTDEAYLRESILKPQATIVKGYEAVPMADFSSILSKEELERLLQHLSSQ